jgi:hypothetical protein
LGVLVLTNTKLTHVFGSKVLVLVLVCYKLTLTPPSKHGHCHVILEYLFRPIVIKISQLGFVGPIHGLLHSVVISQCDTSHFQCNFDVIKPYKF